MAVRNYVNHLTWLGFESPIKKMKRTVFIDYFKSGRANQKPGNLTVLGGLCSTGVRGQIVLPWLISGGRVVEGKGEKKAGIY